MSAEPAVGVWAQAELAAMKAPKMRGVMCFMGLSSADGEGGLG
jgi:hypothetical protein